MVELERGNGKDLVIFFRCCCCPNLCQETVLHAFHAGCSSKNYQVLSKGMSSVNGALGMEIILESITECLCNSLSLSKIFHTPLRGHQAAWWPAWEHPDPVQTGTQQLTLAQCQGRWVCGDLPRGSSHWVVVVVVQWNDHTCCSVSDCFVPRYWQSKYELDR